MPFTAEGVIPATLVAFHQDFQIVLLRNPTIFENYFVMVQT